MNKYDLSKLTVLIVDKQAPMRALLRDVLREFGVSRVFEAGTVDKGFEEFNAVRPDLVLVDWCPEFDGISLVRRIRTDADSAYPQVPIIMVSAYGETRHVYQALDAGMNEYLVKPVSPSLLYMRIASVIETPRPFIRITKYIGPCRRRHTLPHGGPDRRLAGAAAPAAKPAPAETAAGPPAAAAA